MKWYVSNRIRLGLAMGLATVVSTGLFVVGWLQNHRFEHTYLLWNLALAWIPLLLALWLERILRRRLWSSWPALAVTVLLVAFLPNAFYIVTDLIHLQQTVRADIIFDVALFASCIVNALVLGLLSVYILHCELSKRLKPITAGALITTLLAVTSFAIYIGRDLRWNTWDIVLNPSSILFEVSDHVVNPTAHPQAFSTTVSFFVFIGSTYAIVWYAARALRPQKSPR